MAHLSRRGQCEAVHFSNHPRLTMSSILCRDGDRARSSALRVKDRRGIMRSDELIRRDVLHGLAALPLIALLAQADETVAQPAGSPVKVDTKGLVAKIKFEAPLAGFLTDLNGKYKLRVTELTLAPGGHVGEHNHVGPGIRQVT